MQFPKKGRVKLTGKPFKEWHRAVLERDQWQCRRCESRRNLQVHHIIKRSALRLDTMENGVTLCADCHQQVEQNEIVIIDKDANGLLRFRPRGEAP